MACYIDGKGDIRWSGVLRTGRALKGRRWNSFATSGIGTAPFSCGHNFRSTRPLFAQNQKLAARRLGPSLTCELNGPIGRLLPRNSYDDCVGITQWVYSPVSGASLSKTGISVEVARDFGGFSAATGPKREYRDKSKIRKARYLQAFLPPKKKIL
jgi:hypothetical protein